MVHATPMEALPGGLLPKSWKKEDVIRLHPIYMITGDPHAPLRATRAVYTPRGGLLCASHLLGMLSNNQPRELAL